MVGLNQQKEERKEQRSSGGQGKDGSVAGREAGMRQLI